tara:strand:- start:745 stop:930 length:186 start_codon:yes stop_codon:yes gene_type:complete
MRHFYEKLPDNKKGKWVRTVDELSEYIVEIVKHKDIIMLKGSNGVGLIRLLKKLKDMGKPI